MCMNFNDILKDEMDNENKVNQYVKNIKMDINELIDYFEEQEKKENLLQKFSNMFNDLCKLWKFFFNEIHRFLSSWIF